MSLVGLVIDSAVRHGWRMFTVYSLAASDEPLQVRYVGLTGTTLAIRLRGHWHDTWRRGWPRKDHRKSDWMRAVRERGAEVVIHALSEHATREEMNEAEGRWIAFWAPLCELLNLDGVHRVRRRSSA